MSCNLHLKPSWFLGVCMVLIYGGGFFLGFSLWRQLPWGSVRISLVFLMGYSLYSFYYGWRHFVTKQAKAAILTIALDNEQWFMQTRGGEHWQGELMQGSVVVPPVLFLRFRPLHERKKQLAVVTADSVSPPVWRQFCQCLRIMSAKDPSLS